MIHNVNLVITGKKNRHYTVCKTLLKLSKKGVVSFWGALHDRNSFIILDYHLITETTNAKQYHKFLWPL